jgi:hypothetical protein
MVQYCPRQARGSVRVFAVEHEKINANRQDQHNDQDAKHGPIIGPIG